MSKDFDEWNKQKKKLHEKGGSKYYHPRDIWWCRLELNIGYEQDGKDTNFERPVLVLKSFGPHICLIIPLTTSPKSHLYRIPIGLVGGKNAIVMLSQMKVIDTKRFIEKIQVLDKETFTKIQKQVRNFF